MMGNNKLLLGTWAAGIILVGYRSFHNGQGMPAPKSLIGVTTIWTMLTFFALIPQATKLANVLSVGVIGGLLLTDSTILGAAPKTAPPVNGPGAAQANNKTAVSQINKEAGQTA